MNLALLSVVLLTQASTGPQLPVELESHRKPSITTGGNVFIRNGRVLTVTGGFLDGADILVRGGKIERVGKNLEVPSGVTVIDATGRFVSPGLVDAHSHRGQDETNEWTDAIVAEVRVADVLNPDQAGLYFALASGITTGLVLHGSANPVGGQSVVIKHKWRSTAKDLIFPGAPRMIKFALGENVINANGRGGSEPPRFPLTRMGVEAVYRRAFADARQYIADWAGYRERRGDSKVAPPRRDLRLEALAGVLQREIWVQCHSYRQDEMLMMLRLSEEFGFKLNFQHALEAYKIAPELAKAGVGVSMFGDGHSYKLEVADSIPMGAALCDLAGVLTSVNTDTFDGLAPLSADAAKAIRYGVHPDRALRLITINAAKEIGVDRQVGSIEAGKDADLVIWAGHPLSTYSKALYTLIEGEVRFQRRDAFSVDATSRAGSAPAAKTYQPVKPLPKAGEAYLLRGGTVHPISGPAIPNGSVLIRGERIVAVGRDLSANGAVVVDIRGLHVYPGFIDAGSTAGINEWGQVPQTQDHRETGDFQPDLLALRAINPESTHFPKVMSFGITSALVRPVGSLFAGQGAVVHTHGYTSELMNVKAPATLHVTLPEGVAPFLRDILPPDQLAAQERSSKARLEAIGEHFARAKRYAAARQAGEPVVMDAKLEAMRPYVTGQTPVVMHVNQSAGIRAALRLAKEHGLKIILAGAAESWKLARLIAEAKVPVILNAPTVSCPDADEPSSEMDPYDSPLAVAEMLRRAGVKFALQTGGSDHNLAYRAGRLCAFGLSHEAAVRSITLDAAQILGVEKDLGSLARGKLANVVVTDGDPLELTTEVRTVFVQGRPVPLRSRFTDLFQKYRSRF